MGGILWPILSGPLHPVGGTWRDMGTEDGAHGTFGGVGGHRKDEPG